MEVTASILSSHSHFHTSLPSLTFSKFSLSPKPSASVIHLCISNSTLPFPLNFPLYPSTTHFIKPTFKLHSAVEEVSLEEIPDETQEKVQKRKPFVVNLPYSLSSDDLKNVFGQCGAVRDVELIRHKGGKNRGYAFVTMASGEEAQAVIDKFHSTEMSGRTIRVEYSRRLKKPRPQPEPSTDLPAKETLHKLYVSNLQWKVRSIHLREFFSTNFNPIAVELFSRVVHQEDLLDMALSHSAQGRKPNLQSLLWMGRNYWVVQYVLNSVSGIVKVKLQMKRGRKINWTKRTRKISRMNLQVCRAKKKFL